jgi:hypothetical protein
VHRDGREEAHGNEERNLGCHLVIVCI